MRGLDDSDLGPGKAPQAPPARGGVASAMAVSVVLGGLLGAVFAAFVLPQLMLGAAIGGALTAGALRASLFVFTDKRSFEPEESER